MKLDMQVDAKELQAAFDRAPGVVNKESNNWIKRSAARTERRVKTVDIPVDQGPLQSSVRTYFGNMTATVKPNKEYALAVHEGTGVYGPKKRPITPKTKPFLAWKTKGGTWAYAKSVKGIKPNPYMDKAYKAVKPEVDRDAVRTLDLIVRSI